MSGRALKIGVIGACFIICLSHWWTWLADRSYHRQLQDLDAQVQRLQIDLRRAQWLIDQAEATCEQMQEICTVAEIHYQVQVQKEKIR